MKVEIILVLVWLHFIADFILQTDKMAINKSKDERFLFYHSIVYGLPFLFFGIAFTIVNIVLHMVVDSITSQITSILYKQNKRHWFFVTIGADQAIHITILLLTWGVLNGQVS